MTKRGLGKGLSALIPEISPVDGGFVQQLGIMEIAPNPNQPRKNFDEVAFDELVASIKEVGLLQPVVVRPKERGYELIAGERRWRAAQEAGLTEIPAIIKESSDLESLEIALVENLQREDLNAIEEANAYTYLADVFDMKQEDIATKVGKNRATVANTVRLLRLNPDVQQMIVDGLISSGHARALLSIENKEQQLKIAQKIVGQGLTVRQVESAIRLTNDEPRKREAKAQPKAFRDISERLSQAFSAKVNVKMVGKKGKIEISFPLDQLNQVVERLLMEDRPTRTQ